MARFFLGLLVGILLVFFGFILLFAALVRFRSRPPEVAENSVIVLRLAGDVPEKPPVELPAFLGGRRDGTTIPSVWMNLKKAAVDGRIKALVVQPEGLASGWAKLEELRSDIEQFRKSGKPVFAYLRSPGTRDYYVALAADRIYLGPEEPLMLKGMRAQLMYFKGSLDKLGVQVEVEHAGKYKDFGDMFTRTNMSPETQEVINSVVDGIWGNVVTHIAEGRKKSPQEVRALVDQGPFTASQALKAGLVDELRFEDQMWGELKTRLKSSRDPVKLAFDKYRRAQEGSGTSAKTRVALVVGEGDIVRGAPDDSGTDESSLTSYGFDKLLKEVEGDSTIKAVIVRIDSPGGEVSASDEMWRQMNLLSKKKPMVISMSDMAASGGYYVAMTGDPIVAYPQTETGSIGVVFGKPVLRGLLNKIGITEDSVQRGRNADIDSEYTPLTPEQREKLRVGIDESYHNFVMKVAEARNRTYGQIEPVAQGRVWLGSQAKEHALVDTLGGLDTAVETVKKKANIPASEQVTVVVYPPRRSLLDVLMRRSQEDVVTAKLTPIFGRVPFHAWMKGGFLRIEPNWMVLR
jgi:protease-4